MPSIRWRNFWRTVARLPEDRTTWSRWTDLVGAEIETVRPILAKQGTTRVVRRRDADGIERRYRVVTHAKDDLVGVDDDTGERIPLTFAEAQLHAVDWPRVVAALRDGLHLSGSHRTIPDVPNAWEIGRCSLNDTQSALVYLVADPRDHIAATLDRLVATGVRQSVVLVADTAAVNADAVARLRTHQVLVVGLADTIAWDERRWLVGVAGPESVFGDLRTLLGLAPCERPAFQWTRVGARCDIVFRGQDIAIDASAGTAAIAHLLENPNTPCPPSSIQAAIHHVDPRVVSGSKGAKNDRQSRDAVRNRILELMDLMRRHGSAHSEYDRWESERDRLIPLAKDGDGLGGADVHLTTEASAGRAIGGSINRVIAALRQVSPAGKACADYLDATIADRNGQQPCYRPEGQAPDWVITR